MNTNKAQFNFSDIMYCNWYDSEYDFYFDRKCVYDDLSSECVTFNED